MCIISNLIYFGNCDLHRLKQLKIINSRKQNSSKLQIQAKEYAIKDDFLQFFL